MRVALLDSVGLLAVWDESDQWHGAADAVYRRLIAEGFDLFTTTFILAECANAAARRPYRGAVGRLYEQLSNDGMIVVPTELDWQIAWSSYRRGDAGDAGLVDQISFAVMRRLGITRAFTNDRHFRAAGMETLF